jgi:hypothetical protein
MCKSSIKRNIHNQVITEFIPVFFCVVRVVHHLVFFYVVLLCVFTFLVPCCDVGCDFQIQTMFGSSLPPFVCRRTHVLFTLFVFVCVWWCPAHIVLVGGVVCLGLVCPMLSVSLDCLFLIAPSVLSNVYIYIYSIPIPLLLPSSHYFGVLPQCWDHSYRMDGLYI